MRIKHGANMEEKFLYKLLLTGHAQHSTCKLFRIVRKISQNLHQTLSPSEQKNCANGVTELHFKNGQNDDLETALYSRIRHSRNEIININGPMIKEQTHPLQNSMHARASFVCISTVLRISDIWLCEIEKRWILRTFRSPGEEGDRDNDAIDRNLPAFREKIAFYESKNVFNAEESGLL